MGAVMRIFSALLNSKLDKLDPDVVVGILQGPDMLSLAAEPTEKEVTVTLRSMTYRKAVGSDEFPVKL